MIESITASLEAERIPEAGSRNPWAWQVPFSSNESSKWFRMNSSWYFCCRNFIHYTTMLIFQSILHFQCSEHSELGALFILFPSPRRLIFCSIGEGKVSGRDGRDLWFPLTNRHEIPKISKSPSETKPNRSKAGLTRKVQNEMRWTACWVCLLLLDAIHCPWVTFLYIFQI